jgi:hypothetical protein
MTTDTVTAVSSKNLFVPEALGKLSVQYNGREFSIVNSKNIKSSVARMNLSKELRGISSENLEKILSAGYLAISKIGEDDYSIQFKGRILGGGPFLALVTYVGANIAGGAMIVAGIATAPLGGVGVALIAAGTATVTAAPYTLIATLPAPTP